MLESGGVSLGPKSASCCWRLLLEKVGDVGNGPGCVRSALDRHQVLGGSQAAAGEDQVQVLMS